MSKRKIINDPVYDGFLSIEDPLLLAVIDHPFFQRQRRIKQLGLTCLVYPGAMHTRFSHMLGALNLMCRALDVLRQKGVEITDDECRAAKLAILLHDIGHGPFSHTSEGVFVDISHEEITLRMMQCLRDEMGAERGDNEVYNALSMCIAIFKNEYQKHFLHQLVSSQLDMDRLDYLGRDSFFTGVSEGIVGTDRIISMLNVHDDELVVDEKGIYSVEKFIISRRLMYWQVYMHKTVIAADNLLYAIIRRARELDSSLFALDSSSPDFLQRFVELDDNDVMVAIKQFTHSEDSLLATLSSDLLSRRLPAIRIDNNKAVIDKIALEQSNNQTLGRLGSAASFPIATGILRNRSYDFDDLEIKVLYKDGRCLPISEASDQLDHHFLQKTVTKYYVCYPKNRQ
ncbi:MAG: HD domain-containing protein [Bacteroidales bacterium]|nr:HD domain-containing protein [Bacteroidales bacterium]